MLRGWHTAGILEAGCDEAGRGCIAGPVFAAAVILPEGFLHPLLNDSKKLTRKTRNLLRRVVEAEAIAYGVGMSSEKEIDQVNILNASIMAMHRAIKQLKPVPEQLIIDGNRFKPYKRIPHVTIVKGDATYASIAAASVLAKTHRDEFMEALAEHYPEYGWKENKGYPTKTHRSALARIGPCDHHRRSFRLFDDQMQLAFY